MEETEKKNLKNKAIFVDVKRPNRTSMLDSTDRNCRPMEKYPLWKLDRYHMQADKKPPLPC